LVLNPEKSQALGQFHRKFVISTGAYPDFLPRCPKDATCAALRKESRKNFINATKLDRKSGGAEWRDLRFCWFSRRLYLPCLKNLRRCAPVPGNTALVPA
jgi:hypothetical protein